MKGHLCQSPRTEPTEMKVTQIEIVIPFTGCHLNSCNLLNSISIHSLSVQLRTEPNLKGPKNNKIQSVMFCGSYRQINQCLWISVLMCLQNILTLKLVTLALALLFWHLQTFKGLFTKYIKPSSFKSKSITFLFTLAQTVPQPLLHSPIFCIFLWVCRWDSHQSGLS